MRGMTSLVIATSQILHAGCGGHCRLLFQVKPFHVKPARVEIKAGPRHCGRARRT